MLFTRNLNALAPVPDDSSDLEMGPGLIFLIGGVGTDAGVFESVASAYSTEFERNGALDWPFEEWMCGLGVPFDWVALGFVNAKFTVD